jgi:hypothetical protein
VLRLLPVLVCAAVLSAPVAARPPQPSRGETIRTEFRVFNGTSEVSGETRLRVRPSGSSETGRVIGSGQLAIDLAPGIYDVQAVRIPTRAGAISKSSTSPTTTAPSS